MNFDYDKARELLVDTLYEKRTEAKDNSDENRADNIDFILDHPEYIKKLLDIALLSDIARFVECAKSHETNGNVTDNMGPYCFFFSPAVDPLVKIGNMCLIYKDGNIQEFARPEDMREYLYGVVGFRYQSYEKANDAKKSGDLVVDPLAMYDEVTYGGRIFLPSMFNLMDDLQLLKEMPAPEHVPKSEIKGKQ